MTELKYESLFDFIKGEDQANLLYGEHVTEKSEIIKLEINIEEISDKVIQKIDESVVADFDFSDESLEALEGIIDDAFKESDNEDLSEIIEDMIMNIGSYLGLTIINTLGGQWKFRSNLIHSSVYFPIIESECFPFHRVGRRLVYGKSESLTDFYVSLIQLLGAD